MIEFLCEVQPDTKNYITALLPQRKGKIVDVYESKLKNLNVRLYTDLREPQDTAAWIKQFESITKAFYSIRNTVNTTGRFVNYKQVLNCQRNTRMKLKDVTEHTRTKNTDCPAKIIITLHAIKKRYQGRNLALYKLRKEMPCEIFLILTHNHDLESADALKYRRIPSELKERLLKLYRNGHSPKSALETIRKYICLHSDDPQTALLDRSQCPDYSYCYHLYTKHFSEHNKRTLNDGAIINDLLQKRLEEYNADTDGNSVQMIMHEADYVICVCTPLMKRVHKHIKSAAEVAFVDSSVHYGRCRVSVILTHSACGGLPLAVLVTSSEKSEVLSLGFQMVEGMLGEEMFGGRLDGPKIFFTGDCQAEQTAVRDTWKASQCYISITRLLQSVWAWLGKPKNNIRTELRSEYFDCFKSILYSASIDAASQKYYRVRRDAYDDENFLMYLDTYWQTREQWVLAYRDDFDSMWDKTNNISEAIMSIIKDKLFHRIKCFNVVQVMDYILTTFVEYYEMRLVDVAKNHLHKNIFGRLVELPSAELLDNLKVLNTNTVLVPCETAEEEHYTVNIDALRCTCSQGMMGRLCNHIDWACTLLHSETFNANIDDMLPRKMLYRIATGTEPPSDWLSSLWGDDDSFTKSAPGGDDDNLADGNDLEFDYCSENEEQSTNECLEKGRQVIRKLSCIFDKHLQMNLTDSFVEALEKMCENANMLCTASELESACSAFGTELLHTDNNAESPDCTTKKRKLNPSVEIPPIQEQCVLPIPVTAQMITSEIDPNDNTKPRIAPKISYVLVQPAPVVVLTEQR